METLRIHYRGPLPRKDEKRQPGINPKTGARYIYVKTEIKDIVATMKWISKAPVRAAGLQEPYPGLLEGKIVWRFKNCGDVDRALEVTLDAFQGESYVNDRQIKRLSMEVDESEKWGEDEAIIILRPLQEQSDEERLLNENHELRVRIDKLTREKSDLEKAVGIPCR